MEIMFVLTTVFIAYVVYSVVGEKSSAINSAKQEAVKGQAQAVAVEPEKIEIPVVPIAVQAPVTPPKPRAVKPKPVVIASTNIGKNAVRDPNTGEVTAIANNYRFMKRWIKEALVAEGLLDKVYKNNELDSETENQIKQALTKLENIEKYRV